MLQSANFAGPSRAAADSVRGNNLNAINDSGCAPNVTQCSLQKLLQVERGNCPSDDQGVPLDFEDEVLDATAKMNVTSKQTTSRGNKIRLVLRRLRGREFHTIHGTPPQTVVCSRKARPIGREPSVTCGTTCRTRESDCIIGAVRVVRGIESN
jgi:hypothetical protein